MVARKEFSSNEKLCSKWRGPRQIVKALSNYIYLVELRNWTTNGVHIVRLKFYHESSVKQEAIMSHVMSSEIGMVVSRLMRIIDEDGDLKVQVRWKGLPDYEDTFEPLQRIYDDAQKILLKLLSRKSTNTALISRAHRELRL